MFANAHKPPHRAVDRRRHLGAAAWPSRPRRAPDRCRQILPAHDCHGQWPATLRLAGDDGGLDYDTPSGTFKPFRMEIDHYSDEYDNAPMPYSIFFTQTGNAIHGTYEQRNLGRAVSHGCVRLSVKNAATLWNLVKQEKMANTKVVLSGAIPDAGPVARARPMPLTANNSTGAPTPLAADNPPSPQYQQRYDDNPLPVLFPFLFGR